MAVYEYTAKDEDGNKFSSICYDIENVTILREELARMGNILLKSKCKKGETKRREKVKQPEIIAFVYKLAGMFSAGLTITRCLETIEEQSKNITLKRVLCDIVQSIERGSTLKDAFEKHRSIFSDFFIGMIGAGETAGKLTETLEMSATYMEKQAELKGKVKSTLAYPVIVGIMCLIVMTVMLIFVVPVFSKLYQQMQVSLPIPTQILMNTGQLVRSSWWAILLVVTGMVLLVRRGLKRPSFRAGWDVFKLNMPVFGQLNRMVGVSRFLRTFAMLTSAGISPIKALSVGGAVAGNRRFTEISDQLQHAIEEGNSFTDSLKIYDIFPPTIIQMVASGEEAGSLSKMLNKGIDFLDQDIERTKKSLLTKLEPATTVIMGTIVGLLLLSLYLPMFEYMSYVK